MRRIIVLLTAGAIALGCTGEAKPDPKDPGRPAVVKAPPIVLPSDTAHPDTSAAFQEKIGKARSQLNGEYAIIGAAAVFGDRRTLAVEYDAKAVLRLGDSIYVGQASIADAWAGFVKKNSIKEMGRISLTMSAVGNVYRDSGRYGIRAQRSGGKLAEEEGTYVSQWILAGIPEHWILQRDELNKPRPKR